MIARIVAVLVGLLFVAVAVQSGLNLATGSWLFAGFTIGTIALAALSFWFAISAHSGVANVEWWRSARAGLVLGTVFLLAGYVVPLVVAPDNNLGPLIGVFGTGPAGFALGTLIGFVRARRDRDPVT